jgi:hypothetical protein
MSEWMKFPARSSSVVVQIRGESRCRGAIVAHAVSGAANEYWEKRYSDDGEHVCSVDMWGAKLSRMVSLTVCWFGTSRCVGRRRRPIWYPGRVPRHW